MTADLTPDVCVIGAGSGGLTVAAGARAVGLSVVLVERGKMGGECLNTGCVPSKALIAAARHAHAVRRARLFGVEAAAPSVDWAGVHAHVHGVIAAIAPHDSRERFEGLGATVIADHARFLDRDTVTAGNHRIRARRFVLATGSRPAVPSIPGLDPASVLTNESVFDLESLPGRLLVIGAGPVGLELAQAFGRLGSAVTVVEAARPLANEDPECARIVLDRLAAEGVRVLAPARLIRAEANAGETAVFVEHDGRTERILADRVLAAAGRHPNLEDLGLEAAGIAFDGTGIQTDTAMRTTNRKVFAIGDVGRSFRFTHWAGYQGVLVVRSILTGWPHAENRDAVAWAVFTDPEIAHVGLGEAAARERHGAAVAVHRVPYGANDRAFAERETDGFVKLVIGRRGRILGADIVGTGAAEMAGLVALAISARLGVSAFAGMVLPYPTLGELARRAAMASYAGRIEKPGTARALAALRWIGRRFG